jgi:hypothetical protein
LFLDPWIAKELRVDFLGLRILKRLGFWRIGEPRGTVRGGFRQHE